MAAVDTLLIYAIDAQYWGVYVSRSSACKAARAQRHSHPARRGRWLGDPLTAITMLASLIDQAERMIPELATQARRNRASWADIATAQDTSPEQAELQYSRRSPLRDTREPHDPG